MDIQQGEASLGALERLRMEMVTARIAFGASVRMFIASPIESFTPDQIATHYALGAADAKATALYTECLYVVAERSRKHAVSLSSQLAPLP